MCRTVNIHTIKTLKLRIVKYWRDKKNQYLQTNVAENSHVMFVMQGQPLHNK